MLPPRRIALSLLEHFLGMTSGWVTIENTNTNYDIMRLSGIKFNQAAPVPEPSDNNVLFGSGLICLFGLRKKMKGYW